MKWRNHFVFYWRRLIMPWSRCFTSQISLLTLFTKIKFSRKIPDLQYRKVEQQSECPHIVVSSIESRFDLTLFQPVLIRKIRSKRHCTLCYIFCRYSMWNLKHEMYWVVVLLLSIHCLPLLSITFLLLLPLFVGFCVWPLFVMQYPVYVLVLQSCRRGREEAGCSTWIFFLMPWAVCPRGALG